MPVSLVAAVAAFILWLVARKGHVIDAGRVLKGAPWQIVIFSLGMYLVVYGLRNAGLTDYLSAALNRFAEHGVWGATLGTGFLTAALSSVMNNMPTVLVGALSIDGSSAQGVVKQAMIYANVIGCDLGENTPIGSLATLLWLHVLAQKNITISWGYYFRVGIVMTLPVLLSRWPRWPAPVCLTLTPGLRPCSFTIPLMTDITIYHNPACGTSRNTTALIRNSGAEPTVILYLETPPSRDELKKLIADMGIGVRDLLRKNTEPYEQLGLAEDRFSNDELLDAMLAHPILINRPVVVTPLGEAVPSLRSGSGHTAGPAAGRVYQRGRRSRH